MLSTHTHSTARQHPYHRPNSNSIPESPTPTSTPATNTPPFRPPPSFQPLQAPPSMSFGDLFHKPLPNYLLPNDKDHQLMSSLNHQPSPPTNQDYQQPISLSIYPNHHFSLYPNQPINSSSHPPPPFSNRSSSNSSSSPNSSTTNNNLHGFTPPKHQHLTPTSDQLFSELIPAHPPPPPQQQQQPPIEHHHLNQAAYLFHQSELLNAFSATPSPTDPHHINTFDNQSSPHSSPLLDLSAYSLWPTADSIPTESKLSGAESLFQQQPDLAASFYSLQPPPVSSDQTQPTDPLPIPIPIPPPPPSSGNTTQYKLIDQSSNQHHTHNFQPEPTTSLSHLHHHHLNQPIPECQTTAEESGHNAVEKRYRNNINSHIAALADLVPALHHLRSLPSAATSRRHSSQFIVSTSAIGKIPSGLVDGVKAATKLSKGNILSKSVDYVKHLLRTRSEMLEDVEELKTLIKYRVEGGQILVLEWEEKVNSKVPERERARLMDQSQGEEDLDEEEEQKQSNPQPQQPPLNKKRKAAGVGGGGRRGVGMINKEVVPVVIDELEVFRQPSSTSDVFGSASAVPYPTDFVPGNHFGQNYHPGHQSRRFGGLPASNMLAASMGLSFAAGSAYHYYSYPSSSPRPAEAQEASQIISDQRQITPGSSSSMFKAGLDTVSLASIVFVLVVLLRPDFLVNFVGTDKGLYGKNRKKRRTKVLDSDSEEEDGARKGAEEIGLGSWLRELSGQVLTGTRADEKAVLREAEVDSLLDPRDRRSVLRRVLTSFKLYCLIDWNRRPQARHIALLSLHLRTVLGSQNLLSKKLWDQARASLASSTSEPDYVHEALQSTFIETCSLLSTSLKQSGAISTEPLMRIVERKSELQLIEIWSRILVSAMRKTCPIQVCSTRLAKNFKLDTIDGLPTRVEEAGDAYALQITAARELVDRSIDRISSIGIDRLSPIGSLARLTKGVWALAFARTHVAREVAEELQKEKRWAAVVPYLDLVLGEKREMKKVQEEEQQQQRGVMTRLEKLATVTIYWLSLRKSHLIINVLPNQTWFEESDITTINQSNSRLVFEGLVKQAEDLKTLIAADPVLETDTDLVNGSVKQSVEAVKGGESREYDLIRAMTDCSQNVDVVWKIGTDRLDHLIKDGGMDSSS